MDILATIVASVLMLVGFLVICRTSSEDEEDYEYIDEDGKVVDPPEKNSVTDEVKKS